MNWLALLSTLVGGAIALLGSVLAHSLRSRDEQRRMISVERRQSYVDYLVALDKAHGRLRQLADPARGTDESSTQASYAYGDAGVYETRERLLLAGTRTVIAPAENALRHLGVLRDAVGDGAKLRTAPFHDAYHPFAEALWQLRRRIRVDLGSAALTPADLDKPGWDDRANCDFCKRQPASVPTQAPAAM